MGEYSIREVSGLYDIPTSTLRYYEDLGLLKDVVHNDKNQRVYNDEHLAKLDAIGCFKRTGLPLSKMKEFFEYSEKLCEHIDDVVDMMVEHEESIVKQLHELESGLVHIQHKVRFYKGIKKAIEAGELWPDWNEFADG